MSEDICIQCNTAVRPRQHGLQCDGCSRWQHRKCGTGVTQEDYRSAIRERRNIEWSCSACSQQNNDNDIDNAKSKAHESVFEKSAPRLVEEAFRQHANTTAPEPSRPNPSYLVRAVNRIRQNLRPHDPVDLDFQLDESFLDQNAPNFVRHDIEVGDRRHIVMYTDRQLELLAKAKTWYMDGTFKVVNKPWMQLFSIHAFVASDDKTKQIPLVFCFMSGKRKDDYYAVLRALDRRLPERIELKKVVVDFEMGMWQAINKRFEGIPIQGCAFHWSQAVFRKIQELGLQTDYNSRDESYTFLRRVMALPFLPPEHIPDTFRKLDERVESPVIQRLMDYVYNTWINSNVFKIDCWSVFMCSVRTNNDTEGWHHRLNTRVNSCGSVPFYLLVVELYKESMDIPLLTKLISENKLQKRQRKNQLKIQGQLFKLWDDYKRGEISTSKLLRRCAGIYGP